MKNTKNQTENIKQQSGQVVVILLLLMLVTLSIGLALTQKSVTDVTTSTQSEQSSRAFSAAEAGIEKALTGSFSNQTPITLDNNSTAVINTSAQLPEAGSNAAIEYPPIGRETTAQFWFTHPQNPGIFYGSSPNISSNVDLYFGNPNTTDKPAVEVKIMMQVGSYFYTENYYLDSDSTSLNRAVPTGGNNFTAVSGCGSQELISPGILGPNNRFYYCKYSINDIPNKGGTGLCEVPSCKLILARVRFLYSTENHKLALAPRDGANFPPQVQVYNSTGISGLSERQIQAFKVIDVVPPWFDFAVFSVDEIRK